MSGEKTYSVKSAGAVTGITSESFKTKKENEADLVACGSISMVNDDDDSGPNGASLFSLILGLFSALFLSRLKLES
jgi:hypothetical protein